MTSRHRTERLDCRDRLHCPARPAVARPLFAALLLLGLLAGCAEDSTSNRQSSPADQKTPAGADGREHAHDHGHEHAHHHDPDHKPADFPAAVQRLREFQAEFAAAGEPGAERLQQVLDIVAWLPELAAQSELQERDWSAVDRSAVALGDWLRQANFTPAAWQEYGQELEQLETALSAYHAAESEFRRRLGGTVEDASAAEQEGGE